MSIKSDIMNLINLSNGQVRVNNICTLRRWTENALGEEVDCLELYFDAINDVDFVFSREIESREYEGIVSEINAAIDEFAVQMAEELKTNLKAGYRNAK